MWNANIKPIVCGLALGLTLSSTSAGWSQTELGDPPPPRPRERQEPSLGLSEVRPFQAWIEDTIISQGMDVEPVLDWGFDDSADAVFLGAQVAVWTLEKLELGGRLGFISVDFDGRGDESGLSDVTLYARHVIEDSGPVFSLGATADVPLGDEDVGQSTFDLAVFGAMRLTTQSDLVVLASAGIESIETGFGDDDRDNGLLVGGGLLIPATDDLSLVTELRIRTASDYAAASGGIDYRLPPGGHLRAALALGLDDGTADLQLILGFLVPVY